MRQRLSLLVPLLIADSGCATKVAHPTKSEHEMRVDIKLCSDEAHRKYWMDSVAALYHAYDCLEGKGYTRLQARSGDQVKRAVAERYRLRPGEVCRVPCKRPGTGS